MKLPRLEALIGFLLAAVFTAPGWCADTAVPGTLNYIEGKATLAGQTLNPKAVGSVDFEPGQTLSTGAGKAEILIPGAFFRVGDNSTMKMVSANLTNTEADLVQGQATVEVAELHTYNLLRIGEHGAYTELFGDGLYAFDADSDRVRVLKGEARVQDNDQEVVVKSRHELDLSPGGRLKSTKFDNNAYEATDLYRFGDLRSEYLPRPMWTWVDNTTVVEQGGMVGAGIGTRGSGPTPGYRATALSTVHLDGDSTRLGWLAMRRITAFAAMDTTDATMPETVRLLRHGLRRDKVSQPRAEAGRSAWRARASVVAFLGGFHGPCQRRAPSLNL